MKILPQGFFAISLGRKGYNNIQVKAFDSDLVILYLRYAEITMLSGIEGFPVVFAPNDKKIDIFNNLNKLDVNA